MRKTLLIAWQRIWQVIGKLSYWLGALMPLFSLVLAGAALGLTVWGTKGQKSEAPPAPDVVKVNLTPFAEAVGYVDQAGLLQKLPPDVPEGKFVPYATETQAQAAIAAGDIVGYYVIPADYVQGGHAAYYAPHLTLFSGTDLAFRDSDARGCRAADPSLRPVAIGRGRISGGGGDGGLPGSADDGGAPARGCAGACVACPPPRRARVHGHGARPGCAGGSAPAVRAGACGRELRQVQPDAESHERAG